jgi:amino acid adenylation domain-containing protein
VSPSTSHEAGPHTPIPDLTLHGQVLAQIRRSPHATAVISPDGTLTYAALERESARWADLLVSAGAQPGVRIGVLLPRNRDLVPALLGILRTGSTYVPLDPAYPVDWIGHVARDAAIELFVAGESAPVNAVCGAAKMLTARDLRPAPLQTNFEPVNVTPQTPAYLIYTSGTSGQPKGVTITHRNAVNLVNWARRAHSADELSAVLAGTSICFDLSVFEIFATLSAGGSVVLVRDFMAIIDEPPRHPPTLLNTVPSVMAEIVRLDAIPRSVTTINLAGEPFGSDLAANLWRIPHLGKIRNLYGPAETTTYSTAGRLKPGAGRPSVGRPIDNTLVYVLNAAGERLGPGAEGEICIAGAGVAAGYWNRPDLTRERFCENPFDETWRILYRTGDLGVWRADGELECLGRADTQVKIRGVRVELEDVEARLRRLPGVGEAAVVARSFGPYDQRLVAYVVKESVGAAPASEALRAGLRHQIPEALVPTTWHVVDSLPRLTNGKTDRKSLVAGWPHKPNQPATPAMPSSRAEQVAHEMARVLGLSALDLHANFLASGGDSLRAAEVVARLRTLFGWSVPVSALLRYPTAERLTEFLEQRASGVHREEIALSASHGSIPLSAAQRQLWLFHRLYPDATVHNIGIVLRWRERCDEKAMRARYAALLQRHVPLRSSGIADDETWCCPESTNSPAAFERIDAANRSDDQLRALANTEFSRAFDLGHAPPWRFLWLDRGHEPPWAVLSFHQIIVDQTTLETVLAELSRPAPISETTSTNPSGASLQRYRGALAALDTRADRNAGDHWQTAFRRPAAQAGFPWDRPRTGLTGFTQHRTQRSLTADVVAGVEALARQQATTPYVVLLCALTEALFKWSGCDDVIVGSAFSLRDTGPQLSDVVGFFANALPLRIAVLPHDDRRDLLRRTHDVVLAAHQHKHCPPDLIQAALAGANSGHTASPLPVLFGFLPSIDRLTPDDAGFDAEELLAEGIEGELHLQIRWSPNGASVVLDGRADLFEERTVDALADHCLEALQLLLTATEAPIVDAVSSRGEVPPSPASHSVVDAFERAATHHAERIAIRTASGVLTYADLRAQVLAIARDISGDGQTGPCGLLFDDQALATAASLACLHRGRTYIPLGRSRLVRGRDALSTALGVETVLVDAPMREAAVRMLPTAKIITVSRDRGRAADVGASADPDATLAYVLYTSGSTGSPKGVAQSQRNLLHHATTYAASLGLRPDDRLSLLTTIDFDAAIMDIFGALLSGAGLHVWPLRHRGFSGLAEWIEAEAITILHCTPSVFRALVSASPGLGKHTRSVRFVVLGGEPARRNDLLDFRTAFADGCVLVNGFGPTESTTATQAFFDRTSACPRAMLPIGRPVRGTDVVLAELDAGALNAVGEITIRSRYVTPGYVSSREDLERLSHLERTSREPGIREYKTGDLARILPDGALLHVGRRDEQIKISGIRTELTDIEHALISCSDDLAEAVVVAGDSIGGRSTALTAFLVPKAGHHIDVEGIADLLRHNLPPHLLPNSLLVVSRLPYLANGKVNRRALKRAAGMGRRLAEAPTSGSENPQITEWEGILGGLWSDVLRLSRRPVSTDTFLSLGGKSLEALVVLELLRRRFGVSVPAIAMLGATSLKGAARLAAASADQAAARKDVWPVVETSDSTGELGPQQRSFWFAEQTSPGGAANRVLLALALPGRPSQKAITRILTSLVSRHQMLRSRTVLDGARLMVMTDAPTAPDITWIESSAIEIPMTPASLPDEFSRPFELEREWPVRALGISTPETDVLVLMFHHIAVDSWSVTVLADEFRILYELARMSPDDLRQDNIGQNKRLAAAPAYSAAVDRIRHRLTPEEEQRQLSYWRRQLSNAPSALKLVGDQPRAERTSQAADRESARLSPELYSRLEQLCREHGMTRSSCFLAVWAMVLSLHSGDETVVVGRPVTLRAIPDEGHVVGPLLNTVALPIALDWGSTFTDLATVVQTQMSAAIDHSYVPFERVVETLHPSRDLGRHPIYQASFSYHQAAPDNGAHPGHGSPVGVEVSVLPTFAGGVTCDLALTVEEMPDGIILALDTASDVILPQRRKRMLAHILHVLDTVIVRPDAPLGDLHLLPPAQRRHLLLQLNRGERRDVRHPSILDAISAQVAVRGDAPAFEGAWGALSYADFKRRSDTIAAELVDRGIGRGDYVPVIVSPGRPDVAIAIAAVWKAGAAHVPLDPAWPVALVDRAVKDAAAKVVIDRTLTCLPSAPSATTRCSTSMDDDARPDARSTRDDAIYAIYTSGSTGHPKAAAVAHRGIVNRFSWMSAFAHADIVPPTTLQTTPAVYDSSIWQLFWPLMHGGRCVIPEPASLLDPEAISELIARHGVDVLDLVPSVAAALLPEFERSAALRRRLERIRWLIVGGEALTPHLAGRLRRLFPETRITNLYGPTEASIGCICYELEDRIGHPLPIGRPIFNTQVALLDKRGRPAPAGAVGELCLLGDCVGLGYLSGGTPRGFDRCALPEFGDVPMYRTGDAARWNENGYLEFHGRLDSQIKIRGHRIEPEGLEALIETHGCVARAAIALACADPDRLEAASKLCLFVELKSGAQLDQLAFRAWMRDIVPTSHLPDTIDVLARLPVTAAGKLDRQALPIVRRDLRTGDIPPQIPAEATGTTTQVAIRRAWTRTLGSKAEMISMDVNFFDAGGHSFLLLELRSELDRECNVQFSILDLFKYPTIRAQAEVVGRLTGEAAGKRLATA